MSETSTQHAQKAPPGGGAKLVYHALIGLAGVRAGGMFGKPATLKRPATHRWLQTARRIRSNKKPRQRGAGLSLRTGSGLPPV